MKTRCSSSTVVASINSSLYEQSSPSVRGAPPPPPVLPQSEGMDSPTLSYKVTVKFFCLSVLYVAKSSAHSLDASHLFIM